MKLNNYIVNGKPLGFTLNANASIGAIVQEVLSSYLPIKPTTCMFTGKPILTKPKIVLVDNNPENILFSNIAIVSNEDDTTSSFQHEIVFEFPVKGISIKCWKFDGLDFFNESNLTKISKYVSENECSNPTQVFLDLISLGVKGLVYVSVKTCASSEVKGITYTNLTTESCHYQDLIKYRMTNPTNIVSA